MSAEFESFPLQGEASRICAEIEHAVELTEALEILKRIVGVATNKAISSTFLQEKPYGFRIELPEGSTAHISKDDDLLVENPTDFVATELRAVSEHGVEFFNRRTEEWLRISGFKFEISPTPLTEADKLSPNN